jgi:hypothetical protein
MEPYCKTIHSLSKARHDGIKKVPKKSGLFYFSSASLFSSTTYFSNNENNQRDKTNHQENAPHHSSFENPINQRTTAKTKSQKANQ